MRAMHGSMGPLALEGRSVAGPGARRSAAPGAIILCPSEASFKLTRSPVGVGWRRAKAPATRGQGLNQNPQYGQVPR